MKQDELARLLGLSQTTVSRALGGYSDVSAKTRERVLKEAVRLGYAPNPHARTLATGTIDVIGCIIPVTDHNPILNPIFADFLAGVSDACRRRSFGLSLHTVDAENELLTYRQLAASGSVGGIVIQSPMLDDPRIPLLNELGLPYMIHGRAAHSQHAYEFVDVDNEQAIRDCATYLKEIGHRSIAFFNGDTRYDYAYRRREGFLRALAAADLEYQPDLYFEDLLTSGAGYRLATQVMTREQRPTAIIASSVIMGWGVKNAMDDMGLTLGRDVSVAVFDDELRYLTMSSEGFRFTAMKSSVQEAGLLIAEALVKRIKGTAAAPTARILGADLVIGSTTGQPKA